MEEGIPFMTSRASQIIYALRSHISSNGNKNIGSSGTTQLISGYGKRLKVDQLTSPVFVMSLIVGHLKSRFPASLA